MNADFITRYLGPEYLPGLGGRLPDLAEVLQALQARKTPREWLELVTADALRAALADELARGGSDGR